MAARYGAGQYEDAFSSHRLQNWSVARPGRQHPSLRKGCTTIVTDDRGHLLPTVPCSQASPWGTFVGTWEMPPRIPPARLDLTSRSAAAAARLLDWVHQPTTLTGACNGLRTAVTGRPQEPRLDTQTSKEPSWRSSQAPSEGIQPSGAPLEEPPSPRAGATREPGCTEVWLKADTSPELPASSHPCSWQAQRDRQAPRSHQPAGTDFQCRDDGQPKIPALSHPALREASPRLATPLQVSAPSWGGPAEAEPGEGTSPRLRASPRAGQGEASPRGSAAGMRGRQLSRTRL
ncbi:protein Flattop [Tyto alba]|uniref:protein Flattop-like n=1 Tax=Tyto alba TaxID=56313 RepID=UPI001C676276|nr:protein Flattop-like [Tyto alba]XP_042640756.1 protein Flattop [Tyto alba]